MAPSPILAVVPARGGSRGVIRKNLRVVAGRPLLQHTLDAVAASEVAARLVVSSDDPEILEWSRLQGFEALPRPKELAGPESTIADVAVHLVEELAWTGVVAVFQPTSPLRSAETIRRAVADFEAAGADSLMSVAREPHLFWLEGEGPPTPLFRERTNRQYAQHRVLRETGAIQLVRAEALLANRGMVGERHHLFELPDGEVLDIDTVDDLHQARRRMEQGFVVFRLRANALVGSGHLHHCLQLAEELADHRLHFLLVDCDPFVADVLDSRGYAWCAERSLRDDLAGLAPDGMAKVVVNDVLDTDEASILEQRALGYGVVTIEDLGPGARFADWVVNALYAPAAAGDDGVATGSAYATLRAEFHALPARVVRERPERLLLTFGGTDPGRLSERFAASLAAAVADLDVEVRVVVGAGAQAMDFPPGCSVTASVSSMAAEMRAADVMVTSAGRTVFEAAATGTPVVVVAQNAREATHAHLSYDHGVLFLGIAALVDDDHVASTVRRLLLDHRLRAELSERLRRSIDLDGTRRIADGVRSILRKESAWTR